MYIVVVSLAGAFLAGSQWTDQSWKTKWAERDTADSSKMVQLV